MTPHPVDLIKPEIPDPPSWIDGALKRRLGGMITLLIALALFALAGVEFHIGIFLLVAILVSTLLIVREVLPKVAGLAMQQTTLAWFLAFEMVAIIGLTYLLGGTRWLGVGLMMTTAMLPHFSLPFRLARRITVFTVVLWVAMVWLEVSGRIPSPTPGGLRPMTGDWVVGAASAVAGVSLIIFSLFALQGFRRVLQQNEADLRSSEARLRLTLSAIQEVVFQVDGEGRWALLSPAWTTLTGLSTSSSLGRTVTDFLHPEDHEAFTRCAARLRDGIACSGIDLRIRGPLGEWRMVEARLQVPDATITSRSSMLFAGTLTDITERRALEAQVRQTQRLEAVGRLAGGVAHDFNNVLTTIQMHCEMLESELPPDSPLLHELHEIGTASQRGGALTRQLLSFGRRQVVSPRLLDASATISSLHDVLGRLIGPQQTLSLRTPPGAHVQADPFQLEQIIANLVLNARDASADNGRVIVDVDTMHVVGSALPPLIGDPAVPAAHVVGDTIPTGRWVVVRVRDGGEGISEAALPYIFEPFFTTRRRGEGSGLGLATVYGAVRQARGFLRVATAQGFGTTVEMFLPREAAPLVTSPVPAPAPAPAPAQAASAVAPRGVSVLLVEDESAVRIGVRRMLERRGFAVLEAQNGREALMLLSTHQGRLDLVLSDVVMPEMGGRELARMLGAEWPSLKVLFMSGYTADEQGHAGNTLDGHPLVQKPFTADGLAAAIERVLSDHPPTQAPARVE